MLIERIIHRYGCPLWARSAIQMTTMGILSEVDPKRSRELLCVDLGTEINAGVVSEGRLLRGAQGIAGQIGHIFVGDAAGAVCRCGNTGCLETVAACEAVAREGLRAARDGGSTRLADVVKRTGTVTVADIGRASRLGDPFCADLLARSGRQIGDALATLVNLLNPAVVVVGGELAQTGDICLAAIRELIYRRSHPPMTRDLSVIASRMGRSAGLVGAAAVVAEEIHAARFLEGWITAGSPVVHPEVGALVQEASKALHEATEAARAQKPTPFADTGS